MHHNYSKHFDAHQPVYKTYVHHCNNHLSFPSCRSGHIFDHQQYYKNPPQPAYPYNNESPSQRPKTPSGRSMSVWKEKAFSRGKGT